MCNFYIIIIELFFLIFKQKLIRDHHHLIITVNFRYGTFAHAAARSPRVDTIKASPLGEKTIHAVRKQPSFFLRRIINPVKRPDAARFRGVFAARR